MSSSWLLPLPLPQVRVPGPEIKTVLKGLCEGEITWASVEAKYPKQEASAADKE